MNFTIKKIKEDGSVDVVFSVDNKLQNISGLPVGDSDALTAALVAYCTSYTNAVEATKVIVVIDDESKDLIGVKVDVDAYLAEQAKEAEEAAEAADALLVPNVITDTPVETPATEPTPIVDNDVPQIPTEETATAVTPESDTIDIITDTPDAVDVVPETVDTVTPAVENSTDITDVVTPAPVEAIAEEVEL